MGGRDASLAPDGAGTFSVVVPAFDEEASIRWAIGALREGLTALEDAGGATRTEIVVVDDQSTDATAAILAELAATHGPTVRPIDNDGPRGLGAAIRRGLAEAEGDLVLYTDADLPFDPIEIPRLIGAMNRYRADIVCGYRLDRTVEGTRRAVQSHAYNYLVRALLPIRVRDVNFACKLLRRSALDKVLPELRSDGPFIDAELVARLAHHHLRVIQVGVDYYPRFDMASTLGGVAATLDIVREAAKLHRELRRTP
jgi:glycosyltransferase involved in cell wall biosynthesis